MTADRRRLDTAQAFLARAAADGAFGGAVAVVHHHGQTVAHWAVGHAQTEPVQRPMTPDTIFDLASLTKPVAGATAALLLVEDGVWSLDDPVALFIPEFAARGKQGVTIRHLLTHTAGMVSWAPTYLYGREPDSALRFVADLPLAYLPGIDVQYSDVSYSMLGHLVRRVTGAGIDTLLEERVWRRLGMRDTGYRPDASAKPRIAATERGNRYEQAMVQRAKQWFDGWRDPEVVMVGEVNDGNTYYALDSVSSHAGLFSTAADLLIFAGLYLGGGGGGVLSPASIAQATADQTPGLSQSRGLGWQRVGEGGAPPQHYGDLLSAGAFGHTGFTGTSMVVDPQRELVIILLTNRTHPDANNDRLALLRPRFHNLVVASLTS